MGAVNHPAADAPGSSFVERRALAPLTPHVAAVWVHHVGPRDEPYVHRSVPHGGIEVSCVLGDRLQVIGPRSQARAQTLAVGATVVGVRFEPWAGRALVGSPTQLGDVDLPGEEVWGRAAEGVADRMAATDPWEAAAELQRWVTATVDFEARRDRAIEHLVQACAAGELRSVITAQRDLDISERQLRRRCHDVTGSSPAVILRVMRFQRFVALAQRAVATAAPGATRSLAAMAAACGYADHGHLTRECRRMTGEPPSTYLDVTVAACGCGHDHRASFERFRF
jgi:AraC-like DNA-binding protein